MTDRFVLDPGAWRIDAGRVLFGGSPLRMYRLSAAGARLIDRVAGGEPLGRGHGRLTERFLDAGVLHPIPEPGSGPSPADVTLVVPAFNARPEAIDRLVAATRAACTIVVDDASPVPLATGNGAEVLRLDVNGGPGAARAAGLARVTTPFVAFLDADTHPEPGWLAALLDHFADERVALVAPRASSLPGPGRLERFEAWRSPLDLGPTPARIRAGTRVSYVPGAALVCRRSALEAIGGFDTSLRFGEDVDLVWRLDAAGYRCRYEPAVQVAHEPKPTWSGWARQRYGYGTSAAPLAARHPGALAPVRVSAWSAAVWLGLCGGWRARTAGLAVAAGTTAALTRKLGPLEQPGRTAIQLAGRGHLYAGRILASGLTRAWWPITLAAALVSRRARRVALAAAVVPHLADWWKDRPAIDPVTAVAGRIVDDAAYGAGLWRGVVRERSVAALVPDLSSWPGRTGAGRDQDDPQ